MMKIFKLFFPFIPCLRYVKHLISVQIKNIKIWFSSLFFVTISIDEGADWGERVVRESKIKGSCFARKLFRTFEISKSNFL